MTIAKLGFEIDSSGAKGATVDLDKLVAASQRAEKAERGLAGASREAANAIGQSAQRIRQAAGATDALEKSIDDIALAYRQGALAGTEMGRELDKLRARFNPVFAASKAYESALEDLNAAHRVGALSVGEYEDALRRLNANYAAVATGANVAEGAMMNAGKAANFARFQSRNLAFQLVDIGQSIPLAFQSPLFALQNLGFQIAQIGQIYAGSGGMKQALTDAIGLVGRFAKSIAPIALVVGGVALAFGGLVSEINDSSDVVVTWGDTAKAVIQLVGESVYQFLEPAINAIAPWFSAAWDAVVTATKTTGNFIINSIRVAVDAVGTAIGTVPDMFETAWEGAKSNVFWALADMTGALNGFLQYAADGFNSIFNTNLKPPAGFLEISTDFNKRGNDADEASKAAARRVTNGLQGFENRAKETFASDPLGDLFGAIGSRAQQNARDRLASEAGTGRGGGGTQDRAAEQAARELDRLREAYDEIIASGQEFVAFQNLEASALGLSDEAAQRLRFEFDLLNEAQRAGIELTPVQIEQLRTLAGEMAGAEAATADLADRLDFAEDQTRGFLGTFIGGIRNGESVWRSFANAANRALDSVIDKLLNELMDAIFRVNDAASGGGGGGLGGILGIVGKFAGIAGAAFGGGGGGASFGLGASNYFSGVGNFGYANGAAFKAGRVTAFAQGGIVSGPTVFPMANGMGLMGEAGAEAVMPLRRMGNGRLGIEAANSNGAPAVNQNVQVNAPMTINIDRPGASMDEIKAQLEPRLAVHQAETIAKLRKASNLNPRFLEA